MRLSRIIMALTVGLAVAAVPAAAGATPPKPPPYPPKPPSLTVTPPCIHLGQTVKIRGAGFASGERVVISIAISPLAAAPARLSEGTAVAITTVDYAPPKPAPLQLTVTADSHGRFTVSYTPTQAGRYIFTAECQQSHRTATATLTVLPNRPRPPHPHGHLPVTGASVGTPMKLGGGLVGAGSVLMLLTLAWRRRGRFGIGPR